MTITPSVSTAHKTLNKTLRQATLEAAAAEMAKGYETDLSWEEHTGEPMIENADEAETSNGFEEGFEAALAQLDATHPLPDFEDIAFNPYPQDERLTLHLTMDAMAFHSMCFYK